MRDYSGVTARTTVFFTDPDAEVTMFSFKTADGRSVSGFNLGAVEVQSTRENLAKLAQAILADLSQEDTACE